MDKTDTRTDIELSDVFISWTSDDKTLKDAIKGRLSGENLKCTDSEEACQGNFEQWREQAARSSSVFLLILTGNSLCNSVYVPLETRSALKMDDAANRIIVVCPDRKNIYNNERFGEHGERILRDERISVVEYEGDYLTEQKLDEIYKKVTRLITNRFFHEYNRATAAEYIELIPLYKEQQRKTTDRQFLYNDLYIPRTITEIGANGEELAEFSSPNGLIDSGDMLFLAGAGGSGKSQYLKQIRHAVDDNTLMIALPCAKVANSDKSLFDDMYDYFRGKIGDRDFYSEDNFRRLLAVKKLLLVLDGMDEIPTERITRRFLDKVREFYEPNGKDTTLLFTGRNEADAGYIALGGKLVRKFRLNSLTDVDIKRLGDNLFLVLGNKDKGEEFYVNVKDLNDEIKSNPLLLSQLAIIYNDSGKIPETIVGIFDAVSEIMFKRDSEIAIDEIPTEYRNIIEKDLGGLLKEFAAKRYMRISQGKAIKAVGIFQELLKRKYAKQIDCDHGARFLLEYIKGRAIYIENEYDDGGEFYHKMFSEYFTAVYYYEKAFNLYDEIENKNVIAELFSHYADAYWAKVLQLFLVKADSLIDRQTTAELYNEILSGNGIDEYTLLFDGCRDLIKHKQAAQTALVSDILQKSVSGQYPPYGPLFWYVPEYELYEAALLAAQSMSGNAKALALVRDVCYIYGQKNNINDITDRVSGRQLFDAASAGLTGVRRALCEIFYLGDTEYDGGKDIYPRPFNVAETLSFRDNSCGVIGRMTVPFDDELGLYSHKSYNMMNGDVIGLVSCPYNIAEVEATLGALPCRKLIGLIFTPTDETEFKFMNFTRCFVRVLYVPENTVVLQDGYKRFMDLICDCVVGGRCILYLFGDVVLPNDNCIGLYPFMNSYTITSISIPDGAQIIGIGAFNGCKNLKEIHIPDSVNDIRKGAFCGCSSLKEVCIPDGIKKIGNSAFDGCVSIESIQIPNSVKEIGSRSFRRCVNLQCVSIPDGVKEIRDGTFTGCFALKEIRIPDGVERIGFAAFNGCSGLQELNIPCGVKAIEGFAFNGCNDLKDICIPDGVNIIECGVFKGCSSLKEIRIPDGVSNIGYSAFEDCCNLTEVEIPNSVKTIGKDAFKGCDKLKNVTLPEMFKKNVKDIGFAADTVFIWTECDYVEDVVVDDIIIEEGVEEIKENSYAGNLASNIVLPSSLKVIGDRSFVDCKNIKEIIIPNGVRIIGYFAFYGCVNLKTIHIPNTVTGIGFSAFEGCRSLNEIRIPNGVKMIFGSAFKDCISLLRVQIPNGVSVIMHDAFEGCGSIQEVLLPDGVINIEPFAFEGCSSLKEMRIPAGVTEITEGLFLGCSSLNKVQIHDKVKRVWDGAFMNCGSLNEIYIPNGVDRIGHNAFENCSSLQEITIPKSVIDIGDDAFKGCTGLKSVTISINFKNDIRRIFGDIDQSIIHFV